MFILFIYRNINICGDEITACCLDNRSRKIILGDIHGRVRVYNPLNGAFMKSCPDDIRFSVQALQYVNESRRFIAGYANGSIRIYDESKLDECPLLRSFDSLSSSADLMGMLFSPSDRSIASAGSVGNIVKLWDYDAGKCDLEIAVCDARESIVCLLTLAPYPLLATSDSMGNVVIWGSVGSVWRGERISGFLNHTIPSAVYEITDDTLHTTPGTRHREFLRRIVPGPDTVEGEMNDLDEDSLSSVSQQVDSARSHVSASGGLNNENIETSSSQSTYFIPSETISPEVLEASVKETMEGEHKWGSIAAALSMAWNPELHQLYTGDEMGNIRRFDCKDVIEDLGGSALLPSKRLRSRVLFQNIKSKPRGNRSALVPIADPSTPYILGKKSKGSYLGINFCWTVSAHKESILLCTWTKHGLLTSSTDRLMKMWTEEGMPIGVLLQGIPVGVRSNNWTLQLDLESILSREKRELEKIIDQVTELARRDDLPSIEELQRGKTIARFSTSSLRSRIEQSSRLLGLVFQSERKNGLLVSDDDRSASSSNSKSTRAALRESTRLKTPYHPDEGDKEKILTSTQMRHKERHMKSIEKKYESGGSGGVGGGDKYSLMSQSASSDIPMIANLSACMHEENPLLGVTTRIGSPSGQQSLRRKLSMTGTNIHTIRQTSIRSKPITINPNRVSTRAEAIKKICERYKTYERLEKAMSRDPREKISQEEKDAMKARKLAIQQKPTLAAIVKSASAAPSLTSPGVMGGPEILPAIDQIIRKTSSNGGSLLGGGPSEFSI